MPSFPGPKNLSATIDDAIFLIKELLILSAELAAPTWSLPKDKSLEMMCSWKFQLATLILAFATLADLVGLLFAHDIVPLPCGQREWEMVFKAFWFSVAVIMSIIWLPIQLGRMRLPAMVVLSIFAGFCLTVMLIVVGIFAPRDAWDGTPVRCEKYSEWGPGSNCIGWLGIVQPC